MLINSGELSEPAQSQVLPINNAFEDLDIAYVTVVSVNADIDTKMEN